MSHWHHEVADPLAQDLLMVKLMMRMTRLVMRMMARLVMKNRDDGYLALPLQCEQVVLEGPVLLLVRFVLRNI